MPSTCNVVFNQFTAISLSSLQEIVNKLKPTGSSLFVIPPRLVKHVLNSIGPNLLEFINKCLESGTVPDYLKHASIQPLLNQPNLDQIYTILDRFLNCHLSLKY